MSVILRPYQNKLTSDIYEAWEAGHQNVLAQMPCRSGKTVTFTSINADNQPSCTIVHRQELVGQISATYARVGVPHNIVAPQPVINYCISEQIKATGRQFYHPNAPAVIAGVDTLIRRFKPGDRWCNTVSRWVLDESHHGLQKNKWGKAVALFPQARGLGVTATPIRADKKSLHADQGGLFHALVQGVGMRELIEMGNVCDYRVIAPEPSINEAELKIGSTGDFTDSSARKAAHKSQIVGDVVRTYQQHTPGKAAIAYTVDVAQAEELAERFRQAGVTAASLDGTTPDAVRQETVDKFMSGQIKVLTNCDLFSEGLDLPGVDVVIMARPTMSFGMFVQQFCRCLTPADNKPYGIIIDHVGNVLRMAARYGMPDTPRRWQLWREEGKRQQREPDAIPHRVCEACALTYEAVTMVCPFCGHERVPEDRGAPEQVDGILAEMSPQLLQQLRMAKAEIWSDQPTIPYGATNTIVAARHKHHAQKQMAHRALLEAMEFWGGVQQAAGHSDSQMQARFLHRFGIDVMSAQGLPTAAAIKLTKQIRGALT